MKKIRFKVFAALVYTICVGTSLGDSSISQKTVLVSSLAEIPAIVSTLSLDKIDGEIIIKDGTYSENDYLRIIGVGNANREIVIKAQTAGKVIITGSTGFYISDSKSLTIEGLVFNTQEEKSAVILEDCTNVRVTQCHFKLQERRSPELKAERLVWVRVVGVSRECRIDHCFFEERTQRGNFIKIEGTADGEGISQYSRIENNYFKNFYAQSGNGYESIVLGGAKWCHLSANTVVAGNLFENCSGESEIISIKSSGNTIEGNTFIDSSGSIYIRIGHNNKISGNYFLNRTDKKDVNGVRVYGRNNRVTNNYFEKIRFPVVVHGGYRGEVTNYQKDEKFREYGSFFCAENTDILFNTIVNCDYTIVLGGSPQGMIFKEFGPLYHPVNTKIIGNCIYGRNEEIFTILGSPENTIFLDNLYYNPEGYVPRIDDRYKGGVVTGIAPEFVRDGQVFRLKDTSPLIQMKNHQIHDVLKNDIQGSRRFENKQILHEQLVESENVNFPSGPLTPNAVGPGWN